MRDHALASRGDFATLVSRVKVDGDRIFLRDGAVWTSAGISTGIDFALALVEDDLGQECSRATARALVVYHRRPGGQSQFSTLLALDPESDRIRAALSFAREDLHEKLPVERLRAEAARLLIETSVEAIAGQVGFADPERMRRAFLRLFGQPPQGIRRNARATLPRTVGTAAAAPRRWSAWLRKFCDGRSSPFA